MKIYEDIENYVPFNEQEKRDREFILNFLGNNPDAFFRSNTIAHMTASAWCVNGDRSKVLMVYHNIFDSWSWTGGHADGDEDLFHVALKELCEETGIKSPKALSNSIYSLEVLTVDGHEKRGEYLSSHLHLNVTYLFEADEEEKLRVCDGENSAVRWFELQQALTVPSEKWMAERIYKKLNEKLKIIKK